MISMTQQGEFCAVCDPPESNPRAARPALACSEGETVGRKGERIDIFCPIAAESPEYRAIRNSPEPHLYAASRPRRQPDSRGGEEFPTRREHRIH